MRAGDFEDALQTKPFVPFDVVCDGKTIHVGHSEQVLLNKSKTTAVVVDEHIYIVDIGHVSSLTLRPKPRARKAA